MYPSIFLYFFFLFLFENYFSFGYFTNRSGRIDVSNVEGKRVVYTDNVER